MPLHLSNRADSSLFLSNIKPAFILLSVFTDGKSRPALWAERWI